MLRLSRRSVAVLFASTLLLARNVRAQDASPNADILKMIQAGLPESSVVVKIRQNAEHWDTSVDALIALKQAGATSAEIQALTGSITVPSPGNAAVPATEPAPSATPASPMDQYGPTIDFINQRSSKFGRLAWTSVYPLSGRLAESSTVIDLQSIGRVTPCSIIVRMDETDNGSYRRIAQPFLLNFADPKDFFIALSYTKDSQDVWHVNYAGDKHQAASYTEAGVRLVDEGDDAGGGFPVVYSFNYDDAEILAKAYIHAAILCHNAGSAEELAAINAMQASTKSMVAYNRKKQGDLLAKQRAQEAVDASEREPAHHSGFWDVLSGVLANSGQLIDAATQPTAIETAKNQQLNNINTAAANATRSRAPSTATRTSGQSNTSSDRASRASGAAGGSATQSFAPPSNTVAPPVPYQKPPSTGGTVVSSGTLCPASGYIFTSYGDAATGVPCTPGQPIKPASGSGGSTQTSSAGSGIQTTPVLTNCLAQSYVDGDLTVTNTCNVPVYATWWVNGHSGSWTLNPSEHTGTGYHSSDVVAGGASYYVCPKNASPADASGHNLTGPASTYVCVVRD